MLETAAGTVVDGDGARGPAKGGLAWLVGGQAISALGSQVTFMALPLIAAVHLHASPGAMGLLGALDNLPYLLFGLAVGALVDRHRRRPVMVVADVARGLAVLSIPVAFLLGGVTFIHLCVVAFAVGIGNIVFDVACQAQLPGIVAKEHLVRANGTLQTTTGIASLAAPGLVGVFIGTVGAPLAMLVDAVSYLCSAVSVGAVTVCVGREPAPLAHQHSWWADASQGVAAVRRDGRLVGLAVSGACLSIAMNAAFSVFIYDLTNRLGLGALGVGLTFMTFAVGGALGAMSAERWARRTGVAALLVGGPFLGALGLVIFALAGRVGVPALVLVHAGAILIGLGVLMHQALAAGLRQSLAPVALRGRVLGTMRFVEWGSMPLGSLIGGAVGERFGAGAALGVAAATALIAAVAVASSPLRRVREVPVAED